MASTNPESLETWKFSFLRMLEVRKLNILHVDQE